MSGKADKGENMNAGLSAENSAGKRDCFARSDSVVRKLAEQESANRDFESRDFDGHGFVERVLIENGLELPVPVESNSTVKSETVKSEAAEPEATESQTAEQAAQSGTESGSEAGAAARPDSVSGASGRAPRLRVHGFTQPWQKMRMGELFSERSERAVGDEELLSVTIGNGVIRQADSDKRDISSRDKSNYKIVRKGDVPYNSMRMWQGAVGVSGYDGIVSPAYTVLIPSSEANGKFFMKLFKKEYNLQIFRRWSQGLTSDTWNLKYPLLSGVSFYVPSKSEQDEIAKFFSGLDRIISVQKRKTETLSQAKKYFLQNMFPRRGESAPRLRVHGFTQPWQTMKFGDVFDWLKNNTLSRSELNYDGGVVRNVHYGDVLVKFGESVCVSEMVLPYITDVSKVERFGDSYLRDGDIVIADTAEDEMVGKCAEMQKCGDLKILSGLHTMPCRPKKEFGAGFLGCYLNSPSYRRQLRPLIQGIKVSSISKTSLKNTCMIVPPSLEEQRLVGRFFSGLDRIISVQERKTELLRQAKKYFLQNMFA